MKCLVPYLLNIQILSKYCKRKKKEWQTDSVTDSESFTSFFPFLTVFLIWVKLGHEIVEGATVVSGAISLDQSSSMEKGQERCEWMELYKRRQSCLRPERVWREWGWRRTKWCRGQCERWGRGSSCWGWSRFVAEEWVPWITVSSANASVFVRDSLKDMKSLYN